ncbi:hypothetical protein DL767_004070 [Monosporascus sp. MG133]|nr:hypothetical protein DL767_004070 [Monosporascus sp. MG133]
MRALFRFNTKGDGRRLLSYKTYRAPDKQRFEAGRMSLGTQLDVDRVSQALVVRAGIRHDASAETKEDGRTELIVINDQRATTIKIKPRWYLEGDATIRERVFFIIMNDSLDLLRSSKHSVQEAAKLAYPAFGKKKTKGMSPMVQQIMNY